MSPFFILAMVAAAVSPMQSVAKATGRLMTSATAAATGCSENASFRAPFGRPKWASMMTLPPLSAISVIVEATRSMRVVSVTRPFSVGTLRSTLRRTRLPETSTSSSVRNGLLMVAPSRIRIFCLSSAARRGGPPAADGSGLEGGGSDELRQRDGGVGHAVREAPFVVVPGQDAHEGSVDDPGLVEVEDRRTVVVVEVHRNVRLVGEAEDALQRAVCGLLHRIVDLVLGGSPLGDELKVYDRDVRGRHADRCAVELALELGQDEADRLGRAGRRRDHVQRSRAGAVEILVQRVQRRLVASVGMDRRHEAVLDADRVVEHFRHRRETVGRARGVGDDVMVLGQLVVVDAVDDGEIGAVRRRGDHYPLGAGGQKHRGLVARGELAGALHPDVDAERLVGQLGRILDRGHFDLVPADDDHVAVNDDLMGKTAVHGVETKQVRVGLHRAEVVDRDDLDILAARLDHRTQHEPPDPSKAVNRYLRGHRELSSCRLGNAPPRTNLPRNDRLFESARYMRRPQPKVYPPKVYWLSA